MGMLIKSMMTPRPVTVQMDDPIEIVKKIFEIVKKSFKS